jgi:hypothetical protein
MATNLFLAYDLIPPGQRYEAVRDRIKSLGTWCQLQYSLFYVHTQLNAQEAHAYVAAIMDANDKLAVIDAFGGIISTSDGPLASQINAVWYLPEAWPGRSLGMQG